MKNNEALEYYNRFQFDWVSAVKNFVTDSGVAILFYELLCGHKIMIVTVEKYFLRRFLHPEVCIFK